jgi:hypothetical protein
MMKMKTLIILVALCTAASAQQTTFRDSGGRTTGTAPGHADDDQSPRISPDWPGDSSMMICSVIRCWTIPQPAPVIK